METAAKYLSLGPKYLRKGLQNTVCTPSFSFQWRGLHYCETRTSTFVDTGIASSAGQRGHRTCSPPRQIVRSLPILANIFYFPKKMGGCVQFWIMGWISSSEYRSSKWLYLRCNPGIGLWQLTSRTHTFIYKVYHNTRSSLGLLSGATLTSIGFFCLA